MAVANVNVNEYGICLEVPSLFLAVLRASGGILIYKAALKAYGLKAEAAWEAGARDAAGRRQRDRGFNLTIGDAQNAEELMLHVQCFLGVYTQFVQEIRCAGGALVLDIGVTVGSDDQYTASVCWEPGDMALLAQNAIALQFSAYPAS